MRTLIIDTDAGSDDTAAIIMALRSKSVVVKAITIVSGNVSITQALSNISYVKEICQSDVLVFAGAPGPLLRPAQPATWFHGEDGLGDVGYRPHTEHTVSLTHASDAIIELVNKGEDIELVTLGPLTNIAIAIRQDPTIVQKIKMCTIMGGAPCCEGNVTPAAEYNIWFDPEAAKIVFQSGLKIRMIGWQLSRGSTVLSKTDLLLMRDKGTELSEFVLNSNCKAQAAYLRQTGENGLSLPDAVAMACALEPSLCLINSEHYVEIETDSELTLGMTVVDRLGVSEDQRNINTWSKFLLRQKTKVDVCWEIDSVRYKTMLIDSL